MPPVDMDQAAFQTGWTAAYRKYESPPRKRHSPATRRFSYRWFGKREIEIIQGRQRFEVLTIAVSALASGLAPLLRSPDSVFAPSPAPLRCESCLTSCVRWCSFRC